MLERCLVLRRRLANPAELAGTLSTISLARLQVGNVEGARESEREALRIFTEVGDRRGEVIGHLHLGEIAAYAGDKSEARSEFTRGLAIAREIGLQEGEGTGELHLGILACEAGDLGEAARCFERSLVICQAAADKRGEANAFRWLGNLALAMGDLQLGQGRLFEAAKAFKAFEMWEELLGCLEDLAILNVRRGAIDTAIRLSALAAESRTRLHLARPPLQATRWATHLAALKLTADQSQFEAEWLVGAAWAVEDALSALQGNDTQLLAAPLGVSSDGVPA